MFFGAARAGAGDTWEGLASFVTALSGLVATIWVVVKGYTHKAPMSPEDLEKFLAAYEHHDPDHAHDEGGADGSR